MYTFSFPTDDRVSLKLIGILDVLISIVSAIAYHEISLTSVQFVSYVCVHYFYEYTTRRGLNVHRNNI